MMKLILLIFGLVLLMGTASATDYYVSTTGDNTTSGNITHPWQNVSYGVTQLSAGDTLYLFDGTWYNESSMEIISGTVSNRVTITSYNGTPTLEGSAGVTNMYCFLFNSYTTISNLTIRNYTHTILANTNSNYSTVNNCTLSWTKGTNAGYVIKIAGENSHYNTISNCILFDSGWNTLQLYGKRDDGTPGTASTYITIDNVEIYNSNLHNALDFYGNLEHIIVKNSRLHDNNDGNIYFHSGADYQNNITFDNVSIYDTVSHGINTADSTVTNLTIKNSNFERISGIGNPTQLTGTDFIINDNLFKDNVNNVRMNGGTFSLQNNIISNASYYKIAPGTCKIYNPLGTKYVNTISSGTASMGYYDNSIFTTTLFGAYTYTPVRYYPTESNCTITAPSNGGISDITKYDITFTPDTGYGKSIVVNINKVNDVSNITANVSAPLNTTMTFLVDNVTNTYNLSVDNIFNTSAVSNLDSIVSFDYIFSSATPTDFEVAWASTTGWVPIVNTHYLNRECITYTNGTTVCAEAVSVDTAILDFKVVVE